MNTPQIHIPASNSPLKSSDEYLWHFTNQENLWNILCGPNGLLAGHAIFMKDTEDCSLLRRLNAIEVDLGCKLVSAFFPNTDMAESCKYLKESVKSGAYRNVFEQGEVPKDRLRFIGEKPFVTVELSAPIATYVRCIRISQRGNVQKSRAIANLVASRIGLSMDYVVDEKMD